MTGKAVVCTVLLILAVATGTSVSSELQDEIHHRVLRQSLECSPSNETDSVCSSIINAGNISTSGNYSDNNKIISQRLGNVEKVFPNINSRCQQVYFAINCISLNAPCGTNVWCSTVNKTELQSLVQEKCTFTGEDEILYDVVKYLLLTRLEPSTLNRTDQADNAKCINIDIGDDIAVPKGIPLTIPPLPGIACEPYSGSVCSAVLGGQSVRTPNHTEPESSVQEILEGAKLVNEGNLTIECEKLLLDIQCSSTYLPCNGSVWCASNGAVELAALFNNSCACPEPVSSKCEAAKQNLIVTALLLRNVSLYQINQVPSTLQCQTLSLGSAAPTTSQTHFYTVFTAALMILVGMMV
uniref:Uncharacterized protein 11 n=1 Tax=Halisarca dujardinii TaxID=2583056 RepID=A0AA96S1Q5_HALDU|nr:uncharacterized protein 11 [Halisarca dujardinii]